MSQPVEERRGEVAARGKAGAEDVRLMVGEGAKCKATKEKATRTAAEKEERHIAIQEFSRRMAAEKAERHMAIQEFSRRMAAKETRRKAAEEE